MIKLPSLQHEFTQVYSGDSALELPDDPDARDRAIKQARETGNWPIREGQQPTLFHFKDPTREEIGWWRGEVGMSTEYGRPLSEIESSDLLLRISLRSVDNFGPHKVKRTQVARGIWIADRAAIDALHEAAPRALGEFSDVILTRMQDHIRPLS